MSKEKDSFCPNWKTFFGFLGGLWDPSLLLIESLPWCVMLVLTLLVLVVVWEQQNSNKSKNGKGIWRIAFWDLVFLHANNTATKLCLTLQGIWYCCSFFLVDLASLTHKQQEFLGTLQNVQGNMTTLNSTTWVSSKRRNKYCHFTHTSISTAKCSRCVRDCECYFCFGCWFQQVSLRGVSVQQKLPEKTLLFSVETAPAHFKPRDAIHVCSAATCPQVWFMKLMQKSEDHFPHKQNWLEQQTKQVSSSYSLGKQTQRIPKLSNAWVFSRTMHIKLSILTVLLKVTTKHFARCLGKNERLCTFFQILFQTF